MRALVLDRADQVAAAWRGRYDRLRLNTSRRALPSARPPVRRRERRCSRPATNWSQHIEHHAAEAGIELRFGTTVEEIVREDGGWRVHTTNGELHASAGDRRHRI